MKQKFTLIFILCIGLLLSSTLPGYAQDTTYQVQVRKDFGYNWGSQIQGRFTILLLGNETNVNQVTFFIDDTALGTVEVAPFRYQFHTDDYADGVHRLFAEVQTKDGAFTTTPALTYNFLNPNDARQQVTTVLLGIGGVIIGILIIVVLIQTLFIKKRRKSARDPGVPRQYGFLGGTICPKCGRPFSRHVWGINLLVGRLDRCENCGKWVMTNRATPDALKAAEKAELEALKKEEEPAKFQTDLQQVLEDTKFIDDL